MQQYDKFVKYGFTSNEIYDNIKKNMHNIFHIRLVMEHNYSPATHDFTLYISYKTTFFNKNYCEVISKRILIIFAPETEYLKIICLF
jgi:hypothetical protein